MGTTCCSDNDNNDKICNITTRYDSSSKWSTIVHSGNINEIKAIYNDIPNSINSRINSDGETALHIAVKRKHMMLIEFLLSNNVNVNIKCIKNGNTALHQAALKQNVYILTMLIHHGANPKICNKNGKTPKSLARDKKIKSIFKSVNIERIRNQRSLKQLLKYPTALNNNDENEILTRQHSNDLSETISSSLPNETDISINESYIGKITEFDQDYNDEEEENKDTNDVKESDFAREVGVELHSVIFFFQQLPNKSEFWNQIIGSGQEKITRSKDLYKLTYALIFATIKTQHNKKKKRTGDRLNKPASGAIKELTRILKHKIKRGRECFSLTKIEYIVGFNNYLYQAAIQLNCIDPEDDTHLQLTDGSYK